MMCPLAAETASFAMIGANINRWSPCGMQADEQIIAATAADFGLSAIEVFTQYNPLHLAFFSWSWTPSSSGIMATLRPAQGIQRPRHIKRMLVAFASDDRQIQNYFNDMKRCKIDANGRGCTLEYFVAKFG